MPSGIYKHKKGYKRLPFSKEWKRKIGIANTGKKRLKKTINQRTKSRRQNGWLKNPEKTKEKMRGEKNPAKRLEVRIKLKGPKSKKHKRKISLALRGKLKSERHKENLSKALRGEKSYFWKGGVSFEPYSMNWTNDLRESIRKRDNYYCHLCGISQKELKGFFRKLSIHHIDYDKKNCNPNNLISLCQKCHRKTNNKRIQYQQAFEIIKILMDKKLVQITTVKKFIDLMGELIKIL